MIPCPKCHAGTLEVSRTPGISAPHDLVASHACGAVYYGEAVEMLARGEALPPTTAAPPPIMGRRASKGSQFRSEQPVDGKCTAEKCDQPIPIGRRVCCSRKCVIRMANLRYRRNKARASL